MTPKGSVRIHLNRPATTSNPRGRCIFVIVLFALRVISIRSLAAMGHGTRFVASHRIVLVGGGLQMYLLQNKNLTTLLVVDKQAPTRFIVLRMNILTYSS